jgi:hypothetical protein
VLIFPHVGGSAVSQVNGMPKIGSRRCRTRRPTRRPNLGYVDQSDDIRGGMGVEGLVELAKFVQEGGTLITEGSTAMIFPEYGITTGVTVEEPASLFVRGSILRGRIADMKSPIAYGYGSTDLPVYFNQAPVLNASSGLRRVRRVRWGWPGRRRWHESECRLRAERDAERGAAAHSTVRSRSERGAFRTGGTSGGG